MLPPPEVKSAKIAIARLRKVVEECVARLEALGLQEADERITKAAHGLINALEKVLELEEQQRKRRNQRRARLKQVDDAWRDELARRIAQAAGGGSGSHFEEAGDPTAADRLASVGQA